MNQSTTISDKYFNYKEREIKELESRVMDIHRRCGIAVTQEWIRSELDKVLQKIRQML